MKIIKRLFVLGLIAFFLTGCFNIPLGDGNKLKLSKDGITITDEEGEEHSITIDEDKEQLKVQGFGMDEEDDGVALGENLSIPNSFPKDIPIPDDANVYQTSDVKSVVSVFYETMIQVDQVIEEYESYFNSSVLIETPDVAQEQTEEGVYQVFEGVREDGTLHIQINGSNESEDGTKVNIVFSASADEEYE